MVRQPPFKRCDVSSILTLCIKNKKIMKIINYSDLMDIDRETIKEICAKEKVVFDFKFFDIEATMKRNVMKCAEMGGYAVTVADNILNRQGISTALEAGRKYGINIIVGDARCGLLCC